MFEYGGVGIRAVEPFDLEWMRSVRNEVQENLSHQAILSEQDQQAWYRSLPHQTRKYYVLYGIRHREGSMLVKDCIGYVRFDEIDKTNRSIRVGGDIDPAYQRQGYGTAMVNLIKHYCFDQLDMYRLWLLVLATNEAAIRLYERSGFVLEGNQRQAIYRDGGRIDYLMFSILRSEYEP